MTTKIVNVFICALLIVSALPAIATQEVDENEAPSCGLATTVESSKIAKFQLKNDIHGLSERALPFYGYCALDPNATLVKGPISFNPETPGIITQIAPTSSSEFISGGTWALGKWYGCEYGLGKGQPLIWRIHPVIGEMTQVGSYDPNGIGLSFSGLAYNHNTGIMYGCSNSSLYKVNMNNGSSSFVGNFGIPKCIMIAIAFDGFGNLYGTELTTDTLYSINPISGAATPIGNGLGININYAQDMAFDIDSGILYLSAYTIAPVKEGALYTCNTDTGAASKVGTFQGAAEITGFAIPFSGIPQIIPNSIMGGIIKIGQPKIQLTVKNIGGLTCINVSMKIKSKRGLILALGTAPVIPSIPSGETANLISPKIIGIGLPRKTLTIIITQTNSEITYEFTKNALVFGTLWYC